LTAAGWLAPLVAAALEETGVLVGAAAGIGVLVGAAAGAGVLVGAAIGVLVAVGAATGAFPPPDAPLWQAVKANANTTTKAAKWKDRCSWGLFWDTVFIYCL